MRRLSRAFVVAVLVLVDFGVVATGLAHHSSPRVTVALRVGAAASARVTVGQTLTVEIVATTTAEIDGARVTVFADPTLMRFDGGARGSAFPLLSGVVQGGEPGWVRLDAARAVPPWPSGTVHLGTMRFIAAASGATALFVVTSGTERTRVAGNRQELALVTSSLSVVIGDIEPTATPFVPPTAQPTFPPPAPAWRPSTPGGEVAQALASSNGTLGEIPVGSAPVTVARALQEIATSTVVDGPWANRAGTTPASLSGSIPVGFEPGARPVASEFSAFYASTSGMRLLGRPMGEAMSHGGLVVQYFEKGRLELHPEASDGWKFQLGLLVDELARVSALVPIGGDTSTLTYADVARLSVALRRVSPPDGFAGGVTELPDGSTFVPFDATLAPSPGHVVPKDFWRFLNDPAVFPGGWLHDAGLPVTPVAEAVVTKGAVTRTILVQAFQRTILTLDAQNPSDYVVECANAGTDFLRAIGPGSGSTS
jgi:hypothetical protein